MGKAPTPALEPEALAGWAVALAGGDGAIAAVALLAGAVEVLTDMFGEDLAISCAMTMLATSGEARGRREAN